TGSGTENIPDANLPKLYIIGSITSPLTVDLNITGGTATRGVDYTTTPSSGIITMTLPVGEYDGTDATAVSLSPYIQITNDAVGEADETINMTIQTPSTGLKIADANICGAAISSAVYTILDGTLPIKLTSFTAQKQNGKALLKWHTDTEINTTSIVVEKSTAGILGFTEIGRIAPTGDDSYYSFTDNHLMSGVNYYRLKTIDWDGHINYSEIRSINNNGLDKEDIQLFPNPVKSKTQLTLPGAGSSNAVVTIYNAQGALVQSENAANKQVIELNFSKLSNGIYLVKYSDGGKLYTTKALKQ
ncbi:MAG: T9SS type A sorting domain-containing protein, partial [Flavobacterium sp.]